MKRAIVLALVLAPAPVLAYEFIQRGGNSMRWPNAAIDYYQEVTAAPAGIPAVVDQAFDTWDLLPSITVSFTKVGQQAGGLNRGFTADGVNVVSYGDANAELPTGVLAATVDFDAGTHGCPDGTCSTITESDIVFNDGVDFTDSEGASLSAGCIPQVTGRFDAEAVALHEIGHLLGLQHPAGQTYETAIMFPSISDCDPNRTNPRQDDIDGVTFMYSSGTAAAYPGFTVGQPMGYPPHTVSFTDTSTGSITSYDWDFGDGGTSTATDPTHEFTAVGSYTVRLTLNGTTSSEVNDAVVVVARPEPDFSADVVAGDPPLTVNFSNSTPNATQLDFSWSFGDGGTSIQRNATHTYDAVGYYTVQLEADAGPGPITMTKTKYIKVGNPAEETLIPGCECRVAHRRPSLGSALLALAALALVRRRR